MTGQLVPTVTWHYWDGDSWEDISGYVLDDTCQGGWGMSSNRPLDRLATPGEMSFDANNSGGLFDPDNANVLTGWALNTKVKMTVTYSGYSKIAFYGHVTDIQITDNSTTYSVASIAVLDWLDYAYRYTITQQSIETYKRGDQVVDTIVDAVGHTPQATEYAVGDYEFEAAFDSMTVKTKAATELNKIVLSEGGYFYNRHDRTTGEKLVFENATYRNGLRTLAKLPELSTSYLLKAGSATDHVLLAGTTDKVLLNTVTDAHMNGIGERYERSHGENILNKVKVTAYPKRTDTTEQTLYALGDVLKISSGETKTINVKYQNSDTKESCNAITSLMIQPVATTDYLMNTKKDGTGTNITSDLTVSVVFRTAEAEITLTNASAYTGKITKLKLRGYGVYQDSSIEVTVEDAVSQTAYSESELNIEQQYQRDTTAGQLWAGRIVAREAEPRTVLNKVTFSANKSEARMLAFLAIDIGDLVRITESGLNIDGYYYINGVEFGITAGNIITYSWVLSEAEPSVAHGTLTSAAVEFTYNNGQVLDFGRIHEAEDAEERTVIVSVYPRAYRDQSLIDYGGISVAHFYDSCRYQLYLKYASGTEMYIGRTNAGWTGDYGIRYSSYLETNIQTNAWARIAVTEKVRDSNAEPTFYVNGAAVALQMGVEDKPEGQPCLGSKLSEDGIKLYIGGYYMSDTDVYTNNNDGLLKNVLFYNRILSAAEIALDAAGTLITDGLVFRGLCIPTSQTADYYDAALTTSQLLFDDINGVSGIPRGTPTCREIT